MVTSASTNMRTRMEGEYRMARCKYSKLVSRTVDVGPPKKPLRRANADGNLTLVQRLLLYDFLEVCRFTFSFRHVPPIHQPPAHSTPSVPEHPSMTRSEMAS